MVPAKKLLLIEFALLCVALPTYIIAFRMAPAMFMFLWIAACFCVYSYMKTPGTKGVPVWRWNEVNWKNLKPILIRWALSTTILIVCVYIFIPERAFSLPRERPELWIKVMIIYPLLSASPQEFIFCTYFFARYKFLFRDPKVLIAMGSLVFAYAHVLYINPVAPILSLFAGYFFAKTYVKTRSLALVSLEHALYGNMVFTIGLGIFFFGGMVKG